MDDGVAVVRRGEVLIGADAVDAVEPLVEAADDAAGDTTMPGCEPVSAPVVSRTVSDCVPAVFRAALKVCTPASAAVKV